MFTQPLTTSRTSWRHSVPAPHLELNRLLATAVIDHNFCEQLLQNPRNILDAEYQGQVFCLDIEERALLLSIHAQSLKELAQQLLVSLRNQPVPVYQVSYIG